MRIGVQSGLLHATRVKVANVPILGQCKDQAQPLDAQALRVNLAAMGANDSIG
jgi:hypothetical protein